VRTIADEAELLTIAVRPGLRRRGLGARLLGAALDLTARRGAVSMFLEVAATNQPALALYQRAGFRLVGRRTGYYVGATACDDALILRRDQGLMPGSTA
jgi:ribosomal-protein-alanine N-acetyltransferase